MQVVVASESSLFREQLRKMVLGVGTVCGSDDCISLEDLSFRQAKGSADLVLVDVQPDRAGALTIIREISLQSKIPILSVGPATDPKEILENLRSGIKEHLDVANLRDEFLAALTKLEENQSIRVQQGQTIAVISVKAGLGVTTVATNLAFSLAKQHPKQVVLAELSNGIPELALDLDLTPRHGIGKLLEEWQHIDNRVVRATAVPHEMGVDVLARDPEVLEPFVGEPKGLQHLAVLLRSLYTFSVLDLGSFSGRLPMEILKLAEAIVVVVQLDVPSLRTTGRFISLLKSNGVSNNLLIPVANRYGQRRQVSKKKAEEVLGFSFSAWIPDDPGSLNNSLNNGQPLIQVAKGASVTKQIGRLAQLLNGQAQKK